LLRQIVQRTASARLLVPAKWLLANLPGGWLLTHKWLLIHQTVLATRPLRRLRSVGELARPRAQRRHHQRHRRGDFQLGK
jgi:hypothetical protein